MCGRIAESNLKFSSLPLWFYDSMIYQEYITNEVLQIKIVTENNLF